MEVLFILNIETNSDDEFNQTIQQYLMQDFQIESNTNNTCILKKEGYNKAVFWVLIILGILTLFLFGVGLILILIAIIYYVACNDDVVMINKNSSVADSSESTDSKESFCSNCGVVLSKEGQFCPNCGFKLVK